MNRNDRISITKKALLGQAVGDAFGVPVEFLSREEVRLLDLRDMAGADTNPGFFSRWGNRIPKGSWSDDTSMTVAWLIFARGMILREQRKNLLCALQNPESTIDRRALKV